MSTGSPNGPLVLARPTSFDGSPNGSTPSAPPAAPARHRSPRQGRDSSYRGRDSDFALHRGRFSDFALASDFARKILRKRCCPRSIADRVFFHHSHALPSILAWAQDCHTQSWRGHRIATLNPGVGTGLPHSILAWAQDCRTQSWRGRRIATLNPGVGTGLPRCFPENAGSAALYSTTPPDSPPGLRGKHRQCVGTHRCTPGLAARIARKTTEAHCCIAGRSRKTPPASCCVAVH